MGDLIGKANRIALIVQFLLRSRVQSICSWTGGGAKLMTSCQPAGLAQALVNSFSPPVRTRFMTTTLLRPQAPFLPCRYDDHPSPNCSPAPRALLSSIPQGLDTIIRNITSPPQSPSSAMGLVDPNFRRTLLHPRRAPTYCRFVAWLTIPLYRCLTRISRQSHSTAGRRIARIVAHTITHNISYQTQSPFTYCVVECLGLRRAASFPELLCRCLRD
ncbi:hypothetical protein C8Q74DRAFT_250234 [Fomes fomentarius]|nr:hypothetical protein C8Q74DRAFT_250234 [Fomes fomentarius]